MRSTALPLAVALLAALPSTAFGYEERLTVGVEAGGAAVAIPAADLPCCGVLLGLESSFGLTDVFSLRGHAAAVLHPGAASLGVGLLGAELLYLVDVVEVVPQFGLGVDVITTLFEGAVGAELGLHATLAVEYLLSRDLLVGVDFRAHYLPLGIVRDGRVEPVYFTLGGRFSWLFDL